MKKKTEAPINSSVLVSEFLAFLEHYQMQAVPMGYQGVEPRFFEVGAFDAYFWDEDTRTLLRPALELIDCRWNTFLLDERDGDILTQWLCHVAQSLDKPQGWIGSERRLWFKRSAFLREHSHAPATKRQKRCTLRLDPMVNWDEDFTTRENAAEYLDYLINESPRRITAAQYDLLARLGAKGAAVDHMTTEQASFAIDFLLKQQGEERARWATNLSNARPEFQSATGPLRGDVKRLFEEQLARWRPEPQQPAP